MVLDGIEFYGFSVLNPDYNIIGELEKGSINYIGKNETDKEEKYVEFQHGSIHECDFEVIKQQNIGYLEVAQYADGWYSCLPFVEVFSLFKREDIQKDYLENIHRTIFARVSDGDYIGNWNLLIGNIPLFLHEYEINIDWEKIYSIFNDFLDLSLIYRNI